MGNFGRTNFDLRKRSIQILTSFERAIILPIEVLNTHKVFSEYHNVPMDTHKTHFISESFNHLKTSLSSAAKPLFKELQQLPIKKVNNVSETMKNTSGKILDALVNSMFKFVDQPLLPSQKNFAPVEEIGSLVEINCTEGEIPPDFAEGVYIRNGNNPLFGAVVGYTKLTRTVSPPCTQLRFGAVNKYFSNTNVFEHSGRVYSVTENYLPQEVDISTLETLSDWDVNGAWDRPFTGHPKKAPSSGELVIMGTDAKKPYYVLGLSLVLADGKKLHKADLKFKRSVLSHDIGVTQKYNVIIDHPLTVDIQRLAMGGQLMKYEKEGFARIGVMPRYGDAESVKWFEVQTSCTFHILNCFEEGDEVVVRGCRALSSLIPGPDGDVGFNNKFEWFSKGFNFAHHTKDVSSADDIFAEPGYFFSRVYEWRLNMVSGEVEEKNLTGTEFSMEFPFINDQVTGLKHKYGYTQVVDSMASSTCGMGKFGSLAKLYLEESYATTSAEGKCEELIKVEYHKFEENNFCNGSVFVARHGGKGTEEDDGWIVSFVHNEETDVTQVHVIDTSRFGSEAIAKLTLPQRVPYGFHGTFLRFGTINKHLSNTNVFEHSGRLYSIAENYLPQEMDILTLETICDWNVNGAWNRPFSSHPKKAPNSGELVIMGVDAKKPYCVLGVISADGKLLHKVDLEFKSSTLSHDIGVTQKYNVIIDHPLTVDVKRVTMGGLLLKYEKEEYARIGVMPRYGDSDSVKWFEVQTNCTFHILNCFEEANEAWENMDL
ncbi:carotenoid cleavage dioxygenase 1 [Prunus dulcis]|uniref:Carotenoid cleavage dioxygenase 1 n=1 Tax=Prunus dulcis TaxID=3755 RepID=A0A4Y1QU25_PRUDU|nr:carotenoid cleavage dioxygenase 1 [Prunus dulcis]